MSMNCRAIAVALFLLCGVAGISQAVQPRVSPGSPFVTDVWETSDKLPDNTVLSVIQSHDGYLWVGTLHGLARFDGLNFAPFDEKDLGGSRIFQLFEDSHTNLWVGTDNAGILLFKRDGEITRFPIGQGIADGQLTSVSEDDNGTVWLRLGNGIMGRYWSNKLETVYGQFSFVVAEKKRPPVAGDGGGAFSRRRAAGFSGDDFATGTSGTRDGFAVSGQQQNRRDVAVCWRPRGEMEKQSSRTRFGAVSVGRSARNGGVRG
jgi:hypothetical protein